MSHNIPPECFVEISTSVARHLARRVPTRIASEGDLRGYAWIRLTERREKIRGRRHAAWVARCGVFDGLRGAGYIGRRYLEACREGSHGGLSLRGLPEIVDPRPAADVVLANRAARRRLRGLMDSLPATDQAVLRAVYDWRDRGDSGAARARRLGQSRATVSRHHRRVLARLRRAWAAPTAKPSRPAIEGPPERPAAAPHGPSS